MFSEAKTQLSRLPSLVKFVVLFQFLMNLVIFFDVSIIRQIVGFVYLTFIPGFVVLIMLKLDKEDFSFVFLFSAGLSIAFLMLVGLAVNELLPVIGVSRPLSTIPLMVALNLFVLVPCAVGYIRHTGISINNGAVPRRILLFISLPLLSVLGALLVNTSGNITLLLMVIVIISAVAVSVAIFQRFLPSNFYAVALFLMAVALLFHTSLITSYIVGWDVHSEYYVFRMTENAATWTAGFPSWDDRIAKSGAMLSTTVLPTIYSQVLNIDGTMIFKVIYPLIFALVPFALFRMYSTQQTKKAAFLSVFFLMSNLSFFAADGFVAKQMVAQLFFVLLFLVLLKERTGTFKREFLLIIFGFALVVSHYSTSYIFLFFVLFTWIFYAFFRRLRKNTTITLSEVVLFFSLAFAWYIFTSGAAPFDAVLNTGEHVILTLSVDFFNPSARSGTVLKGLGGGDSVASVGHQVGRIFFYITEIFIVVGFLRLILKRKNTDFSPQFVMLSSLSMAILGMAVILPNLASSFRMERFYQISLLFLAPLCIAGAEIIFKFVFKKTKEVMIVTFILLVLIPNLLFQTGLVYAITGDVAYSLPFDMSGPPEVRRLVVYEEEVRGAEWLSSYKDSPLVYADYFAAFHVLTSYGLLSGENTRLLSIFPQEMENMSYTYLRQENIVDGTMVVEDMFRQLNVMNTSDISSWLNSQNLIYSNGGSQILKGTKISTNSTQG